MELTGQTVAFFVTTSLTALGLFFTAKQIKLSREDFNRSNHRLRVEKAIELSGFYRSEILPQIGIIRKVMLSVINGDIKDTIDLRDMQYFNKDEMNVLLSEKQVQKYLSTVRSEGNAQYLELLNSSDAYKYPTFHACIVETLNKLEEFSMYFNYKVADEETVYQSLHQTYRAIIKVLYIHIAYINDQNVNKYYTNITKLFICWENRFKEKQQIELSAKEASLHCGKEV